MAVKGKYDEYQESVANWVGAIPKCWSQILLSQAVFQVKNKNLDLQETNLLSLSYGNIKRKSITENGGLLPESFDGYNIIEANDIVLRLTDLQNDQTSLRVGISTEQGIITSAYVSMRPRDTQSAKYIYYLLHAFDIRKGFYGMGSGVRQGLNYSEIKKMKIPYPPIAEQVEIAKFLDTKILHIDSIIAEAKVSIEDYKKWNASIIYEAVAKGLDSGVEMKDSGIPWIGEIPADWDFIKITRIIDRNHAYPIGDGDHGLIKATDYVESGIPYIRVQNLGWGTELKLDNVVYITSEKNSLIKNSALFPNDILFAKTGGTIGKTGIIPSNITLANATSHVGKITVSPKYNAKFIFYVLSSKVGFNQFWEIASAKTTRPELSIDEIKSLMITLPKQKSVQDTIVKYLDEKCPEIDILVAEKEALIADLEAYKKSLIFEVVTGKRKVV